MRLRILEDTELQALGLDRTTGFIVSSIAKDSAAEKMYIKANDVLLAINGIAITSSQQLVELMTKGPILSIKIWREGAAVTLRGELEI